MSNLITDFTLLFTYGTDCKNNKTALQLRSMGELYHMIRESDRDLVEYTKNLRSVLRYSKERYRTMKTGLPFFSCSVFDPAYRGVQHFKMASGMIIDIDYDQIVPEELLNRFRQDPRVAMGYVSPSNAGVKLLFIFDAPVTDAAGYTAVYKYFSHEFAMQYHIADHIDLKNCDVSRISFLCHDPLAWYNDDAIPIDTIAILKHAAPAIPDADLSGQEDGDITPSVYREILKKLNTRPKSVKPNEPIHPDVTEVLPALTDELSGYGILIKETESIQYGAKLRIYRDKDQGELNIYYGRQGYKVVSSPRKGTHPELNEVAKHIIEGVLVRF